MKNRMLLAATTIFCALPLFAQQRSGPSQANPQDISAMEQRIKDLEDRIITLEGQVRMLKSTPAPAAEQPAAAAVPPQPAPPAPQEAGPAASVLPVYGGGSAAAKALNPDISVIGDFIGKAGGNSVQPGPSLEMHESEVGLQARPNTFCSMVDTSA